MNRVVVLSAAILLASLAVGLVVPGLSSAQVGQDERSAPLKVLTEEEALAKDAGSYADLYGVSLREAIRRLELQKPVAKLRTKLEANEAATFAGLFIQHEPEYRVAARFTRGGEKTLGRYARGGPLEGLVEAAPASATLAELRQIESDAARLVRNVGIPADSAVNVGGNRVEVMVTDEGSLQRASEGSRAALSEEVVVKEVEQLAQPAQDSLAGLKMFRFDVPAYHWCTSGFTVRRGADTEGVLTAAHCTGDGIRNNSRTTYRMHYKRPNGSLVFLPREGRRLYGSWDLEWHATPGYDDLAVFFDGNNYRSVTGLQRRTETGEGDLVCDYGRTTGYSCSTVTRVDYRPDYVPDASATFIRTRAPKSEGSLMDGGDSGGPVFLNNDAAGIMSGYDNSGANYTYMIYVASGYPEDMLVSIQTN